LIREPEAVLMSEKQIVLMTAMRKFADSMIDIILAAFPSLVLAKAMRKFAASVIDLFFAIFNIPSPNTRNLILISLLLVACNRTEVVVEALVRLLTTAGTTL
jgi:hypothetical protein